MGAAVLAQAEFSTGGSVAKLTLRQRCELLRGMAETERASFITHWRDLGDHILPRRARFTISDVNKGDRRSQKIFDGTATQSVGTLGAGLMSSVTNASRPWFHLTTPDQKLNENEAVKEWLYDTNRLMQDALLKSNFYDSAAMYYLDLGTFGTAAMLQSEDDEQIFRFKTFAIGEYSLANDAKDRVRTFVRTFRLTVLQVVEQWGEMEDGVPNFLSGRPTTISTMVQNLYKNGALGLWIDLVHLVQANRSYDARKIDAKYKAFESVYYEIGAPGASLQEYLRSGVLEHSGYDEFPIFCARWSLSPGDVYATNCPGMTALGDIRELQVRTKRTAQAVEKMITPPMAAPSSMRSAKMSTLPGDVTYVDVRDGMQGFKPVYEVNFAAAFGPMEQGSQAIRQRIKEAYYVNLFLMLEQMSSGQMTATEVNERTQEKLLALGPLLGRLDQDFLTPVIDRSFNIMLRKGLLPPPPPELENVTLHVEYISILAQALKAAGVSSLDRAAGFAGQVAQYAASALDVIDTDELMRTYFEGLSIPPKVLLSDDAVTQKRAAAQQQQATQQAAQNAPALAGAAKDLSQASTTGSSVLANLVNRARAKSTVNATSGPVPTGQQ